MVAGDLSQFLVVLGLGALLSTFLEEDISSVDTLSKLTDEEFKTLGIKLGARVQIRAALQVYELACTFHLVILCCNFCLCELEGMGYLSGGVRRAWCAWCA